jgi:hypothetical protein
MKTERIGYLLVLLVAVFVVSSAALSAQNPSDGLAQTTVEATAEATMDGTPEVIFNDGRINNAIILGEFGIFCEDVNGDPAGSFDNGGRIAVYGSNGEQYIFAEEEALRQYSDMDMMMDTTAEPSMMATNTPDMMSTMQPAILLGQATATNGTVRLFLVGDNEFRLTGFLPDGKGFIYGWTGCTGNIRIDTFDGDFDFITTTPMPTLSGTFTPLVTQAATMDSMATQMPTMSSTLETTVEVTTSP